MSYNLVFIAKDFVSTHTEQAMIDWILCKLTIESYNVTTAHEQFTLNSKMLKELGFNLILTYFN